MSLRSVHRRIARGLHSPRRRENQLSNAPEEESYLAPFLVQGTALKLHPLTGSLLHTHRVHLLHTYPLRLQVLHQLRRESLCHSLAHSYNQQIWVAGR